MSSRSTGAPLTEPRAAPTPSAAAAAANPPSPGPGVAPGNAERTAPQADPGAIGGGTTARPERYLVIARHADGDEAGAGEPPRYLFARWADWPHPTMLSLAPPGLDETVADAVARLLDARFGVSVIDEPRVGDERVPARMPHPRTGVEGLGWLRPVAVTVRGSVTPDALVDGYARLTVDEARAGLSTDVERVVFARGVTLLD